jgi:hypothetical protein
METFGKIVLAVLLGVVGVTFSGYALSILWGWFIVETFNAPQISIPVAIGISIIIDYLSKQTTSTDADDEDYWDKVGKSIGESLMKPAVVLLFGWIVTLFM